MAKRLIIVLVATAGLLGLIGFVKFQQIQAAIKQGSSFQPPPEAVTTIVTRQEKWPQTVTAIGSVTAVHGVTVSADLPGVVRKITFDSGKSAGAGQMLVELDTSQERAQLAAAEAQRDLAKLTLDRARGLRERDVISQADLDRAQADFKQADANVDQIRAVIGRKQIRAPFGGVLGLRQVNLGQYLAGGDPVVSLQSMDPVYVNFSVPQQEVGELRPGDVVRVAAESAAVSGRAGRVTAINSLVDEATRNMQVQATFQNPDHRLRPGMFVNVEVLVGSGGSIVALPASAVSFAPYGNSVFVVENLRDPKGRPYKGVSQRFVKLGPGRGDQVAVLSGIEPGEEVVTSGVFKLRNGAAVLINNQVQPSNNPKPKPEDS
jgi:membrane fusion protein (multidrug efflux system)